MAKRLFYIGQHVICINDDFSWVKKKYPNAKVNWPRFAQRYIVRGYVCDGSHPAIVLQEIKNPDVIYKNGAIREAGFWDARFVGAPPPIAISSKAKRQRKVEV
jgi:hypothetical protein